MSSLLARRAVALAALAAPFVLSAPAWADAPAEKLVTAVGGEALQLSKSDAGADAWRSLLERYADMDRISKFVLGRYGRAFTADQQQRFRRAFASYLAARVKTAVAGVEQFSAPRPTSGPAIPW
jgi:phospholipid transport system substrate-binding protein